MKFAELKKILDKDLLEIFGFKKQQNKIIKNKETGKFLIISLFLLVFLLGIFTDRYFNNYIFQGLSRDFKYLWQPSKTSQIYSSPPSSSSTQSFYIPQISQEKAVINAVKQSSPAVVNIIISKEIQILERYYESPFEEFKEFFGDDFNFEFKVPKYKKESTQKKQKKQIGGGTGFIISKDGTILTNKHVIVDEEADYTAITNDGEKYSVKILAKDPFQDLAILKIEPKKQIDKDENVFEKDFPVLTLGDSSNLEIGQSVIAIGNALGEFRNTVSVGVISGLGRTISASGGGIIETLEDIIQTDAAINQGNSGGPLLNLKGEVIGVNTAIAQQAQGIGFAIPINNAKRAIDQIKKLGKIVYPFLGVRYILINPEIQEQMNLKTEQGALISGEDEIAIEQGSAADKAGIKPNDIILEVNGEKITIKNSLAKIIQRYNPGDKVVLKILRKNKELKLEAVLGEKSS